MRMPLTEFGKSAGLGVLSISVARYDNHIYVGTFNTGPKKLESFSLELDGVHQRFVSLEGDSSDVVWHLQPMDDILLVATEMAVLTRTQVLAQAGVSMLAQANTMPQMALSLLR